MRKHGLKLRMGCVAAVLVACLVMAGCGSGSGSASSTTAESSAGGSGAAESKGSTESKGSKEAEALLAKAEAPPTFTAPGPAFDAEKAGGKTMYIIPITTELPAAVELDEIFEEVAKKYGVKVVVQSNKGAPSEWSTAMQQAINAQPDLIMTLGMEAKLLGESNLVKAEQAGIKVISAQAELAGEPTPPHTWATSGLPSVEEGAVLGAYLGREAGPSAKILYIDEPEHASASHVEEALKESLNATCPECELSVTSVPIPEWATKLQSTVSTELTKDPSIKWVVPQIDSSMQWVGPALEKEHGEVLAASMIGSPFALEYMEGAGSSFFKADTGVPVERSAWGVMDLVLRALAGEKPYPNNENHWPVSLFTLENQKERTEEDGFKAEFEKLWSGE